jgi:hypothetical protein
MCLFAQQNWKVWLRIFQWIFWTAKLKDYAFASNLLFRSKKTDRHPVFSGQVVSIRLVMGVNCGHSNQSQYTSFLFFLDEIWIYQFLLEIFVL